MDNFEVISASRIVFVAGTDTGVGKTFICAQLLRFLKEQGEAAGYQKWVSTGDIETAGDLEYCRRVSGSGDGVSDVDVDIDTQVPFRFGFPASPHLAAELEGRQVDPGIITQKIREMAEQHKSLIVEGVGGLFVPLRRDLLLVDFLAGFRLPTLLVARSGLGTLNHTLLSLEALRNRDIPVLGVVFCDGLEHDDEIIVADNIRTVAEFGRVEVLGRMPWIGAGGESAEAAQVFAPIGRVIRRKLSGCGRVLQTEHIPLG